uniref:Putative secreted protein n=1 Tax=Anopheles darlingi TaxID=43151 RepID=A0A2M4D5V6_ANODA
MSTRPTWFQCSGLWCAILSFTASEASNETAQEAVYLASFKFLCYLLPPPLSEKVRGEVLCWYSERQRDRARE